jgi:hypothetical protein
MVRAAYILAISLALSAWAGAQGPEHSALSAADQLRLHRANRVLLIDLVDRGIELGKASHPIDRADECRKTARVLGVALQQAAEKEDADRVAEIGNHLELVLRDGLVPMLDDAKRNVHPMSPDAARLKLLRENATDDLVGVSTALRGGGSSKMHELSGRLDGLKDKLK